MTTTSPTSTGGTVVTWSVSPSLPAGLSLDTSTGVLSGTPTAVTSSASYTITATNTGGTDTASVTIVVNDVTPTISYGSNSLTLEKGTTMTTQTPTVGGGTITSWSVSPSLPAGSLWIPQPVPSVERLQQLPPLQTTPLQQPTQVVAILQHHHRSQRHRAFDNLQFDFTHSGKGNCKDD